VTSLDIPALRRLLAEATPGPWVPVHHPGEDPLEWLVMFPDGEDASVLNEANAALIAALVNAAPALLDRVEAAGIDAAGFRTATRVASTTLGQLTAERDQLRAREAELLAGADADGFELTRLSQECTRLAARVAELAVDATETEAAIARSIGSGCCMRCIAAAERDEPGRRERLEAALSTIIDLLGRTRLPAP
jgi:hypothetical protein